GAADTLGLVGGAVAGSHREIRNLDYKASTDQPCDSGVGNGAADSSLFSNLADADSLAGRINRVQCFEELPVLLARLLLLPCPLLLLAGLAVGLGCRRPDSALELFVEVSFGNIQSPDAALSTPSADSQPEPVWIARLERFPP